MAVTRLDSDKIPGCQRLCSFTFYLAHGPHLTPLLSLIRCLHEILLYLPSALSHISTVVQAHHPHYPHPLTNPTRPRNAGMITYHFVVSAVSSFLNGGLIFRVIPCRNCRPNLGTSPFLVICTRGLPPQDPTSTTPFRDSPHHHIRPNIPGILLSHCMHRS